SRARGDASRAAPGSRAPRRRRAVRASCVRVGRNRREPAAVRVAARSEAAEGDGAARLARIGPGYVFTAPSSGPGQSGAMIFDDSGELVWFHPVLGKALTDFKVQTFRGKPVLTWWEGKDVDGVGDGEWVVLDTSYRQLARFTAARGLPGDLHEFTISPENTALVTSNELRPWNGRRVIGGVVQELTLPDA